MDKEKICEKGGNLILVDTNVLINAPYALERFMDGKNKVVIPLIVLTGLDQLKKDPRIGADVREVIREIEKYAFDKNPLFEVEKNYDFSGIDLDKSRADYKIMATLNYILKSEHYRGYHLYKVVSNDLNMRIMAHALFKENPLVSIEPHKEEQVEQKNSKEEILILSLPDFFCEFKIDYNPEIFGVLNQNAGIVIEHGEDLRRNLFIRSGDNLKLIKNDYSLFGLQAINGGNEPNYGQLLAFHQLLDSDVNCIFLQGKAGTGKTLIALAAALAQRKSFEQVIIANPMVSLSNNTKMGFLPGDMLEKSAPWLMPFEQNIRFLEKHVPEKMSRLTVPTSKADKKAYQKNSESEEVKLWSKYGLICQPLEYIRGQTIADSFIIVEESQNLSQHEIKTIVTRLGKGSKIVFCGDLSQIDIPYLTENSSGLTYAIEKMVGTSERAKMTGSVMLIKSVRSELAAYASEVL